MGFHLFVIGVIIIIAVFIDFFYTTLSGNGSGFLTKYFNNLISKIILGLNWKWLRKISGFLHVTATLNLWLILLLVGCFFVFSSNEPMVINSSTDEPASFGSRFYYTCYILSTVGIGDYVPDTSFGQIVTGLLSFSGFILLTTALAYVISITGAVSDKRDLAVAISSMGNNPKGLYNYFTQEEKLSLLFDASPDMRQLLHTFTHNYLSYPMIENYLTNNLTNSEGVQLVNLYEVLRIVFCQSEQNEQIKLLPLIRSFNYFMKIHMKNEKSHTDYEEKDVNELRVRYWTPILQKEGINLDVTDIQLQDIKLENIDSLLASSGWSWTDIYDFEDEKSGVYE